MNENGSANRVWDYEITNGKHHLRHWKKRLICFNYRKVNAQELTTKLPLPPHTWKAPFDVEYISSLINIKMVMN
jgi:hypothetical protein